MDVLHALAEPGARTHRLALQLLGLDRPQARGSRTASRASK
jgi:hypothetical protein